ncbi:cupin domain-containing protein [Methylopila sp. M107]|uniref:cupin domain-containing protein n=1 Tax=Methylopila sp. M107 TaxID=1101190 RepID=UPI000478459B|nr:cupin domain-containing protein [Methylopila sp. M107]
MKAFHDRTVTEALAFGDDGETPNYPTFPLLLHRGALDVSDGAGAPLVEALFGANGWGGMWRNGVYPYHHFHSSCHEALGVAAGWAEVQFGGEQGATVRLEAGDVAVLPAGTGHRLVDASSEFLIVGAYPPDQPYDLIRSGEASTRQLAAARERIAATPVPANDPVFGSEGGLRVLWRGR